MRDPVAVAELGRVAVQVLLGTVLVQALHPDHEDREIPLDRVRVDVAVAVRADVVGHDAVLRHLTAQMPALASLVRVNHGLAGLRLNRSLGDTRKNEKDSRIENHVQLDLYANTASRPILQLDLICYT